MSTVAELKDVQFRPNSVFVYSTRGLQDRENVHYWRNRCEGPGSSLLYRAVLAESAEEMTIKCDGGMVTRVNTRDLADIRRLFPKGSNVVIDISGLNHDFWAGCLKVLTGCYVSALTYIYTEPEEYQRRPERDKVSPFDLFDLSPRTLGPRPLSGFLSLDESGSRHSLFVPLLGFEGQRALNVLNEIDPGPRQTIPIIGIPGYQVDFPAYTAYCNQEFFERTESHGKWRSAPASDPFAVKSVLGRIREDYPEDYMYLAPISTRPHVLGALLFVRENPNLCEVLFDRPVTREKSRRGRGPSHLYCIVP